MKMKKISTILCCTLFILAFSIYVMAGDEQCTTIQDGTLRTSAGDLIMTGFAESGYNYQAHIFNGMWDEDYYLMMKWNDAWLSNKDCDGDGSLDRHLGHDSYIGSGAWLTNHMRGTYPQDGKTCKWTEFYKIVAVPADAKAVDGVWYTQSGVEIGPVIWGQFAIIEHVLNDKCGDYHGVQYVSPDHPGLGNW